MDAFLGWLEETSDAGGKVPALMLGFSFLASRYAGTN